MSPGAPPAAAAPGGPGTGPNRAAAAGRRRSRVSLILVARPRPLAHSLVRVAGYVREYTGVVVPYVLADRRRSYLRIGPLLRPVLWWSPHQGLRYRPWRGRGYAGRRLLKSQEYTILDSAGVPVPRWAMLTRDNKPDMAGFGRYVVTKPDLGSLGADVKIRRASRLEWQPPRTDHVRRLAGEVADGVVQQYVHTGPWPVSYRVLSLFGVPLLVWRQEANRRRTPIVDPERLDGVSVVSSAKDCTITLVDDPEIEAMAKRAHAAFPDWALLGIDLVREHGTGRVFVLETNPHGWPWHFGTPMGRQMERDNGISFESQRDGVRTAARLLADRALAEAR